MKRIKCLKVSYNTPENGNVHCGVKHEYFQLGVFDRGNISNFFHQGARAPEKDENDANHGICGGKHTKILLRPFVN